MPEHAPPSVPELDQMEHDALDFFRTYEEDIQLILRNPRLLMEGEEWKNFTAFIAYLDSALAKSTLPRETLLFRGMGREIAGSFLFMLDMKAEKGEGGVFTDLIPHIIRDPGYTILSTDPETILQELPGDEWETRVVFACLGRPGDTAIVLDEEAGEVLYPRNANWVTTGATTVLIDQTPVVVIGIEMAGCGEEIA
ncbi:MAG: hypothetical protein GKC07_06955 [Methanomicrobiales archaeon]|nr:hypothetical protein [Methanomicrobiales archaeon]